MSESWNASEDFSTVVDTLETVTLKRQGCDEPTVILAWRFDQTVTLAWPGSKACVETNTTWQIPSDPGVPAPCPGDRLVDVTGRCWIIRSVDAMNGGTRRRCESRETVIRRDLAGLYDLERAVWQDLGDGPEIVDWITERGGLLGCLEFLEETGGGEPGQIRKRYRLGFLEQLEAGLDHRFRSHEGTAYRVVVSAQRTKDSGLAEAEVEA